MTETRRRIEDRFLVIYVTAAGHSSIWSEWPTREVAEDAARERVTFTGRSHWVAEVVSTVEPAPPTVVPR